MDSGQEAPLEQNPEEAKDPVLPARNSSKGKKQDTKRSMPNYFCQIYQSKAEKPRRKSKILHHVLDEYVNKE